MFEVVKKLVFEEGFAVIKMSSTSEKFVIGCAKSGKPRIADRNSDSSSIKRDTKTIKSDCPFRIYSRQRLIGDEKIWKITSYNLQHNHHSSPSDPCRKVYYQNRQLTLLDKAEIIQQHIVLKATQGNIARHFEINKGKLATPKDINNVLQRFKQQIKDTESNSFRIGEAMEKAIDLGFIVNCKRDPGNPNVLEAAFFIKKDLADLTPRYCDAFQLDSTYKTNTAGAPLLQIIAIDHHNHSLPIGFAFLVKGETQDIYIWALTQLREICIKENLVKVIISDKEPALRNAITKVFPNTVNLHCKFHLLNNIKTHCLPLFKKQFKPDQWKDKWDEYLLLFHNFINAASEKDLNDARFKLRKASPGPVWQYLERNWMGPKHEPNYLQIHLQKLRHLNMLTTSRTEGWHSLLKRNIGRALSPTALIVQIDEGINKLLKNLNDLDHYQTMTVPVTIITKQIFKKLFGKVSHFALKKINDELERTDNISVKDLPCICSVKVWNLPCIHSLQGDMEISLESIDKRFHLLSVTPNSTQPSSSTNIPSQSTLAFDITDHPHNDFSSFINAQQVRGRGRPKNSLSTKRNASAFEMVEKQTNYKRKKNACRGCGLVGHNVQTCPNTKGKEKAWIENDEDGESGDESGDKELDADVELLLRLGSDTDDGNETDTLSDLEFRCVNCSDSDSDSDADTDSTSDEGSTLILSDNEQLESKKIDLTSCFPDALGDIQSIKSAYLAFGIEKDSQTQQLKDLVASLALLPLNKTGEAIAGIAYQLKDNEETCAFGYFTECHFPVVKNVKMSQLIVPSDLNESSAADFEMVRYLLSLKVPKFFYNFSNYLTHLIPLIHRCISNMENQSIQKTLQIKIWLRY